MIMMTLSLTIIDPELDAIHDADDENLETFTAAAIERAREYLATTMPSVAHDICFDDVQHHRETPEITPYTQIDCSLEP